MEIDPEQVRSHYASLSDEALLEVNRSDLTEVGRQFYDAEISSRRLRVGFAEQEHGEGTSIATDWMKDAACIFEQQIRSGTADAAASVIEALRNARIPCDLVEEHIQPEPAVPYDAYRVMVPSHLELVASFVVDSDVFNEEAETKWRANFEELTDSELLAMDPDVLFGALLNRIERVKSAYREEFSRRGLARR